MRTNSDLCHLLHKLIGFCNRNEKCLQRGTVWVFKWGDLGWVFKGIETSYAAIHKSDQYSTTLKLNQNTTKFITFQYTLAAIYKCVCVFARGSSVGIATNH